MKCLMCESPSFTHICSSCEELFLKPTLSKRKLSNGIQVISFYKYREIKELLHTKHTDIGYYIYNILAQNSFKKFAEEFSYPNVVSSVAVDDKPNSLYSHTSILSKALQSAFIEPIHAALRAQNSVSYSGKSREFRLLNPREFRVKKFDAKELILVDDIITTGSTLSQAVEAMHKENKEVLFCLTLADAIL